MKPTPDLNNLTPEQLRDVAYQLGVYVAKLIQNAGLPEDVQIAIGRVVQEMEYEELLTFAQALEARVVEGLAIDHEFVEKFIALKKEYDGEKKKMFERQTDELDEVERLLEE